MIAPRSLRGIVDGVPFQQPQLQAFDELLCGAGVLPLSEHNLLLALDGLTLSVAVPPTRGPVPDLQPTPPYLGDGETPPLCRSVFSRVSAIVTFGTLIDGSAWTLTDSTLDDPKAT